MLFKKSHTDMLIDCLKTGKPFDINEKDLDYLKNEGYFKPITTQRALNDYLRYPGCNNLSPGCREYKEQLETALDDGRRVFFNSLKSTNNAAVCNYKCLVILPPEGSE
ncbi:MAG: hypothetical protein ABIF85_07190 [Nanoarchaeota archaeon]